MPVTELNIPKNVMYIHILVGVLLSFTIDLLSAFGGGGGALLELKGPASLTLIQSKQMQLGLTQIHISYFNL